MLSKIPLYKVQKELRRIHAVQSQDIGYTWESSTQKKHKGGFGDLVIFCSLIWVLTTWVYKACRNSQSWTCVYVHFLQFVKNFVFTCFFKNVEGMGKLSSQSCSLKIGFNKSTLSRVTVPFRVLPWNRWHTGKVSWKKF